MNEIKVGKEGTEMDIYVEKEYFDGIRFAKNIGFSRENIQKIEQGKPVYDFIDNYGLSGICIKIYAFHKDTSYHLDISSDSKTLVLHNIETDDIEYVRSVMERVLTEKTFWFSPAGEMFGRILAKQAKAEAYNTLKQLRNS